jgi:DNA excision repair protein ERCC-2
VIYAVAVRALCEFTARSGDLDLRFTPAPSALEGMAGHGLVQSRRGKDYETEIGLVGQYEDQGQVLQVRGRADGFDQPASSSKRSRPTGASSTGCAPTSARCTGPRPACTATCCARRAGWRTCRWRWSTCNTGTQGKRPSWSRPMTAADLQAHFEALCARYLAWAHCEAAAPPGARCCIGGADVSARVSFRAGQRELAVAVYRNVPGHRDDKDGNDSGQCLLAQAPTGIGKTLGTLFPLLQVQRAQGAGQTVLS